MEGDLLGGDAGAWSTRVLREELLSEIRELKVLLRRLRGAPSHPSTIGARLRLRVRLVVYLERLRKERDILFPKAPKSKFCFDSIHNHKDVFRFRARHIELIADALLPPVVYATRHVNGKSAVQCKADRRTALCVVLRHLATPERQDRQAVFFGKSESWVSQIMHATLSIMYDIALRVFRSWSPSYIHKVPLFCAAMESKSEGVFFAHALMDGSGIITTRPGIGQSPYYSGVDYAHCLRLVALVSLDGMFQRIMGPYPGSATDQNIMNLENFEVSLTSLHDEVMRVHAPAHRPTILCDSGFAGSGNIMTPYRFNVNLRVNDPRYEINKLLSFCRVPNEWAFGRVVNTFRTLACRGCHLINWTKPHEQYLVGLLLTNLTICADGSQQEVYFNVSSPSLEEYLTEIQQMNLQAPE